MTSREERGRGGSRPLHGRPLARIDQHAGRSVADEADPVEQGDRVPGRPPTRLAQRRTLQRDAAELEGQYNELVAKLNRVIGTLVRLVAA